MTKISRKNVGIKDFGLYVNNLWSVFTMLDSKEDVRAFFRDLFTHTEYKMFAKRLEIAKRLLSDQSYNEIVEALKVTPNTIAIVNNTLERDGFGFRVACKKLEELEKSFKRSNKSHIFPRYKGAPRISELVSAGVESVSNIYRKNRKKMSAPKQLTIK